MSSDKTFCSLTLSNQDMCLTPTAPCEASTCISTFGTSRFGHDCSLIRSHSSLNETAMTMTRLRVLHHPSAGESAAHLYPSHLFHTQVTRAESSSSLRASIAGSAKLTNVIVPHSSANVKRARRMQPRRHVGAGAGAHGRGTGCASRHPILVGRLWPGRMLAGKAHRVLW